MLILGWPAQPFAWAAFALGITALADYVRRAIAIGRQRLLRELEAPRRNHEDSVQEALVLVPRSRPRDAIVPPSPTTPADTTAAPATAGAAPKLVGSVERLDPALDALVAPDARPEVLSQGYKWSEGPVWTGGALLFSDVPNNVIWRWQDGRRASEFLRPSGYTGRAPRGGEPGSNGLAVDSAGRLYPLPARRSPHRRLRDATRTFHTIADKFDGKRFNSPNDLVVRATATCISPTRSTASKATRRIRRASCRSAASTASTKNGTVDLVDNQLSFPNGLAFLPDGKTLYVARSDPARAIWMAYDVDSRRHVHPARVLRRDAAVKAGKKGLPDGLKIDVDGNLFATGPGGVYVFTPGGQAPGHDRHRRADRQLRVRGRRPNAVHDGERQADAHPAEDAGSGRQVTWRRSRAAQEAAPTGDTRKFRGCRPRTRAVTTSCWRRWRCWCWGRWAASPRVHELRPRVLRRRPGARGHPRLDRHLRLRPRGQARRELHADHGRVGRVDGGDGRAHPGHGVARHAAAADAGSWSLYFLLHRHVRRRRRHALHADPGRPAAARISRRGSRSPTSCARSPTRSCCKRSIAQLGGGIGGAASRLGARGAASPGSRRAALSASTWAPA